LPVISGQPMAISPGGRNRGGQVAQHGHVLGAQHLVAQLGHAVEVDVAAVLRLQAGGNARGRHRRLLGGNREVQQVDEHEADRVVHAEHEGSTSGAARR
jgi:hypothetical protein